MVAGADHGDFFKRDMGYSATDFFRILPSAIKGYTHTVEANNVTINGVDGNQSVQLVVKPLPDREIGMIRIPRIEVEFSFHNFSARERKEFMINFDRSYQRGGG
ncbi:MAG: hypothetical protein QNI91_08560 [Arenicellales bacterium]|nr:hypothetical protein [Arenicellales bacterium]